MDLAKIHYPVDGDRKNKMKKIFNKIIILLASFLLFTAIPVSASQINLTPENNQLKVGETFEVKLILNTEDESINAMEATILFPNDLLILNDIRDGNSIINFWIEKTADSSGGQFNFSGIVPGGYIGEEGQIISLVFKAKKEGNGNIEITKCKALLNNENSAESSLTVNNSSFIISGYVGAETAGISEIKDEEKPESFMPEIASDENIFDGKYFLVFSTVDKKSGIDHYEILESKLSNYHLSFGKWEKAESPYLLKDQKLQSHIFIKAIDRNENERIETVSPRNSLVWYKNTSIIIYAVLLLLLVIFLLCIIKKFFVKIKNNY